MMPRDLGDSLLAAAEDNQHNLVDEEWIESSWCTCFSFFSSKGRKKDASACCIQPLDASEAGSEPITEESPVESAHVYRALQEDSINRPEKPLVRTPELTTPADNVAGLESMPVPPGEWHSRMMTDLNSDTPSMRSFGHGSLDIPSFSSGQDSSSCNSTPQK